ncbi:YwdI family protein [Heyndrickxia sporothermodurans]
MSISIHSLIGKMEKELLLAKQAPDEISMKNHIYSMKTLCEVILGESASPKAPLELINKNQPSMEVSQIGKAEPLKTEDGANGESIFDF